MAATLASFRSSSQARRACVFTLSTQNSPLQCTRQCTREKGKGGESKGVFSGDDLWISARVKRAQGAQVPRDEVAIGTEDKSLDWAQMVSIDPRAAGETQTDLAVSGC